ncbi:hypothetical protein ACF0H5_001363 [Mactra antiquata]
MAKKEDKPALEVNSCELSYGTPICSICRDKINHMAMIINCGHTFCSKCIIQWTKTNRHNGISPKCPNCRDEYTEADIITEHDEARSEPRRNLYCETRSESPFGLRRRTGFPYQD